jgi:MinD-like ATPase involved in chromosome partitioning or flagellar assembly
MKLSAVHGLWLGQDRHFMENNSNQKEPEKSNGPGDWARLLQALTEFIRTVAKYPWQSLLALVAAFAVWYLLVYPKSHTELPLNTTQLVTNSSPTSVFKVTRGTNADSPIAFLFLTNGAASEQFAPLPKASKPLADLLARVSYWMAAIWSVLGVSGVFLIYRLTRHLVKEAKASRDNQNVINSHIELRTKQDIPVKQDWEIAARSAAVQISPNLRIIVVASGKGGVGKSLLSLGLLEHYAERKNTLLVDFDLHNHGLTSLLAPDSTHVGNLGDPHTFLKSATTSVYAELERFRISLGDKIAPTGSLDGTDKAYDEFKCEFFEKKRGKPRPFQVASFAPTQFLPDEFASRAFFLPSLRQGEYFLGSDVSKLQDRHILYFLKTLAWWASQDTTLAVNRIIIDCHGAHDLFTLGAILSATDLVTVTTPDAAAFEGTFDLLAFIAKVRQKAEFLDSSVMVLNFFRDTEKTVLERYKALYLGRKGWPSDVVTVQQSENIRRLSRSYRFGLISKDPDLRLCIEKIAEQLDKESGEAAVRRTNPAVGLA